MSGQTEKITIQNFRSKITKGKNINFRNRNQNSKSPIWVQIQNLPLVSKIKESATSVQNPKSARSDQNPQSARSDQNPQSARGDQNPQSATSV